MTKIIATKDFDGACNEHGTRSMRYLTGELYDVHDQNAAVFFDGGLAKPFEEYPNADSTPPAEEQEPENSKEAEKPRVSRKGKTSTFTKG